MKSLLYPADDDDGDDDAGDYVMRLLCLLLNIAHLIPDAFKKLQRAVLQCSPQCVQTTANVFSVD